MAKTRHPAKVSASLMIAVSAVVAVWLVYGRLTSPSYEGRSLSSWLLDLESLEPDKAETASQAVREIGPKAIPQLLQFVSARSSLLDAAKDGLDQFVRPGWVSPKSKGSRRNQAIDAFRILGTIAEPALPKLWKELASGRRTEEGVISTAAAQAMAGIGPKSVPFLTMALTNQCAKVRVAALIGFHDLKLLAKGSHQAVVLALADPEPEVRAWAVVGVTALSDDRRADIPLLLRALNDSANEVSSAASGELMMLGTNAVPWLLNAEKSAQGSAEEMLKLILKRIESREHREGSAGPR